MAEGSAKSPFGIEANLGHVEEKREVLLKRRLAATAGRVAIGAGAVSRARPGR